MADSIEVKGGVTDRVNNVNVAGHTGVNVASPTSESSGDTLHEEDNAVLHSPIDTVDSSSSPISPGSLNFDSLAIQDPVSRFPKGGVARYTTPYQRGIKSYNEDSRLEYFSSVSNRRDEESRTMSPFSGRGGGGGHRNSRTWMSQDAQAMQEFMVIRNCMRRQFRSADVSKWKYADYIAHREAMIASQANRLANKVRAKEDALSMRVPTIPQETQQSLKKWGILGNLDQKGNLGRVLGEQTIWCNDWLQGKDEVAPWPSLAEMKWEGDDRAKTGVGRFLPLPREEGPPGLAWNQLPCVEQYPMDQVARIPTMEDVYLPVDDQIEEDHVYLWSQELESAMDDFLEL